MGWGGGGNFGARGLYTCVWVIVFSIGGVYVTTLLI